MVGVIALASSVQAALGPITNTTLGPVEGLTLDGVDIYRGIPFAAPPTGSFRFRAPQAMTPWSTVRKAWVNGNICPQLRLADWLYIGNEDCLYLDVYTPTVHNKPLPVLVWIYGGGWVFGDGTEFGYYDAKDLVKARDFVVVTFNYRLGPLGFLAVDALKNETANGAVGNYALLDQRAALQWVQANIAAFGGDPSAVTIAGESAGAFSTCFHLASVASRGLFRSAILESGTCDAPQFFQSYDNSRAWSHTFGMMVGCDFNDPPEQYLQCLRSLPTGKIMGAYKGASGNMLPIQRMETQSATHAERGESWTFTHRGVKTHIEPHAVREMRALAERFRSLSAKYASGYLPQLYPLMPWGATIDGTDTGLYMTPLQHIESGIWNNVPVMMGTNKDEGDIFVPAMVLLIKGIHFPLQQQDVQPMLLHFFANQTIVDSIVQMYPVYQYKDYEDMASAILRDFFFACSARRALKAVVRQNSTAYLYHFVHKGDFIEDPILGDYHSSELQFVFNHAWPPLIHIFSDNDWEMARIFTTYYKNFISSGNPNGQTVVDWPHYAESEQNIVLEVPAHVENDLFETQCVFRDSVVAEMSTRR